MCLPFLFIIAIIPSIAESPLTEGDILAAAIVGPVVGVVTILTVVVVISCVLRICQRKRIYGQYDTRSDVITSGEQTRTVYYAQVGFEDDQPLPAPPVEGVTYANPIGVGEEEVSVCGHSVSTPMFLMWVRFVPSCTLQVKNFVPVLPPKQQDHHKSNTYHRV